MKSEYEAQKWKPPERITQAVAEWRDYCQRHNKKYVHYRYVISHLAKSLPETVQTVEQIDKAHIEDFIKAVIREYSFRTLKRYLSGTRAFLRWLSEEYGTALIIIKRQSSLRQHRLSLRKAIKRTPKPPRILRVEGKPDSNVVEEWLCFCRRYTPRTQVSYRMVIARFVESLPNEVQTISQLHSRYIENYINQVTVKYTNNTANSHLGPLKSFHRWLSRMYDIENHAAKILTLKQDPPRQRFLSYQEYEKVLAVCSERESEIVRFLANTGLRSLEFRNLTWDCVHFDNNAIVLTGKGRKRRYVPMNSIVKSILLRQCNKTLAETPSPKSNYVLESWGVLRHCSALYMICKRLSIRAGIPVFGPHAIRHLFATELLRRGVPIAYVSRTLGHASITTTEKLYVHWQPDFLNGITECLIEEPGREKGGA